jgi:hypothetical protein
VNYLSFGLLFGRFNDDARKGIERASLNASGDEALYSDGRIHRARDLYASGFAADALRGKQFAGRVCVVCHVVFKGHSPGDPNAPSFRSVAKSRQFREKG